MNTEELQDSVNRLSDVSLQKARQAAETAQQTAQQTAQVARQKADQAISQGQRYVREKPLVVIASAIAIGFAAGFLMARREQQTLRQRYVDEPLDNAQRALHSVLAPLVSKLEGQYTNARHSAEHALDRLHPAQAVDSVVGQLRRVGSNLKFW